MTKITNTAPGPRGVETDAGTVFIEPGATVDVDVKKGHQLYEGLVEASSEEAALKSLTRDELIARAQASGITVETDDNKADLVRKISENTPTP
jgi:hypothetical protein